MADTPIGRLRALLTLDDREFRKNLTSADRAVLQYGKRMQSVGRQLSRNLSLPLAAAGAGIAKLGTDFQASMTRIETLVGVNAATVEKWRKQLLAIGPAVGKGPRELAEALFAVTSAGVRGGKAMDLLTDSAKASAIGLGDTRTVALAATGAMNAYARQNLSASDSIDILIKTVREGNLEAADLAGTLGHVIPVAAAAGVSLNDVGAAIALVTRGSTPVSEAVTQVAAAIKQLYAPTARTIPLMEQAFGSLENAREQLQRGLLPVFRQLVEQFGATPEKLRKLLGSSEALNAVLAITGQDAAEVDRVFASLNDSSGTLAEGFTRASQDAKFAWDQIVSTVEAAAIQLAGAGVLDFIRDVSAQVLDLSKDFAALDDETRKFIVTFGGILVVLGPVLTGLGLLVGAIGAVGVGFGAAGLAIAGFVGWLVAAEQRAGGIQGAIDNVRTAIEQVGAAEGAAAVQARAFAEAQLAVAKSQLAIAEAEQKRRESEKLWGIFPQGMTGEEEGQIITLRVLVEQLEEAIAAIEPTSAATDEAVGKLVQTFESLGKASATSVAGLEQQLTTAEAAVAKDLAIIDERAQLLGDSFNAAEERATVLRNAIIDLTEKGVKASSPALRKMAADLAELEAAAARVEPLRAIGDILNDIHTRARTINLDPTVAEIERMRIELQRLAEVAGLSSDQLASLLEQFDRDAALWKEAVDATQRTANGMEEIFSNAIENIQRAWGDMFADVIANGIDSFEDFAERLKGIFAQLAGQVISALLTSGIQGALQRTLTNTAAQATAQGVTAGVGTVFTNLFGGTGTAGAGILGGRATLGNYASGIALGISSGIALGIGVGSNRIGEQIGGALGTLIGTAIGGYFGGPMGAQLGGMGGQFAGGYIGGGLYNFFTTGSTFYPGMSRFDQMMTALHLPILPIFDLDIPDVAKGALVAADLTIPGLGLLVTALLTALGFGEPKKAKLQLATVAPGTELHENFWQWGISGTSPFGLVGLYQPATQLFNEEQVQAITDFFIAADETIARYLDDAQIALAAAGLQSRNALKKKFDRSDFDDELGELLRDRLQKIIDAVVGERHFARTIDLFGDIKLERGKEGLLVERAVQFLQERQAVVDLIEQLRNINEPALESAAALERIEEVFEDLKVAAEAYRVDLKDAEQLRQQAIDQVTIDFNAQILRAIKLFVDPLGVALDDLAEVQRQRIREAEFLGADLVAIERLYALERKAILEQFASSANSLLESLLSGPASPLSPTVVLANAEARFNELRDAVLGGDTSKIDALVDAAQNLLAASSDVFASSAAFFERFDFVVATLQNITGSLPGFQSGGSFTVPGGAGVDNVVPLFRASPGETITVAPAGEGPGDVGKILRGIAEIIAEGNADQAEQLQLVAAEITNLKDTVARQQGAIARLVARSAA